MDSAPASAGEAVLVAVQEAALGLVRPYNSEQATRFEAALSKMQVLVGVEPSAHDQIVTNTISGLARQAAAPRQALTVITATACQPCVGRGGKLKLPRQSPRRSLVDIALCPSRPASRLLSLSRCRPYVESGLPTKVEAQHAGLSRANCTDWDRSQDTPAPASEDEAGTQASSLPGDEGASYRS